MALTKARGRNFNKSAVCLKRLYIGSSAIAHTAAKAAHKLEYGIRKGSLVGYATLYSLGNELARILLRFHSGEACDAAAVLASLEHLRWSAFPGRQLWYWDPVDTVEPLDARTLRFRLHHPYARLPALLWGTHTAVYGGDDGQVTLYDTDAAVQRGIKVSSEDREKTDLTDPKVQAVLFGQRAR